MFVDAERFEGSISRADIQDTPLKSVIILVLTSLGTFGLWLQDDGGQVKSAAVLDFLDADGNAQYLKSIPSLSIIAFILASLGLLLSCRKKWVSALRCAHGVLALVSLLGCGLWIFFGSGILRFTHYGFYFQLISGLFAMIVVCMSEEPGVSSEDTEDEVVTVEAETDREENLSGLEVAREVSVTPGQTGFVRDASVSL